MRVEEMYLILAEAQAMNGDAAAGKTTLENFVKTYRDPAYVVAGDAQEAVWIQRRIELWGEGFEYFDLMRLRKGVRRSQTAFASLDDAMKQYNYDIPDNAADERAAIDEVKAGRGGVTGKAINALVFQVPQGETEANALIDDSDNNLGAPTLEPVN